MENPVKSEKVDFVCKIRKNRKQWYINVPAIVRGEIEWKKDKLFRVMLEKY